MSGQPVSDKNTRNNMMSLQELDDYNRISEEALVEEEAEEDLEEVTRGEAAFRDIKRRIRRLQCGHKYYKCSQCDRVPLTIKTKCENGHRFCGDCATDHACLNCERTTASDNKDLRRWRATVMQRQQSFFRCMGCEDFIVSREALFSENRRNFAHLHVRNLHRCTTRKRGFWLGNMFEHYNIELPGKGMVGLVEN